MILKRKEKTNLPPGANKIQTLWETIALIKDTKEFVEKRSQKYGSIFKTYIFGQLIIYVTSDKGCRFILENEDIYFQNKLLPSMEALIGSSAITTQTSSTHKNRKKILKKVFTPRYLETKTKTISEITDKYINRWNSLQRIEWYCELQKYSFDIACKLFVGLENASNTELGKLYQIWSEGLFSFTPAFPRSKTQGALDSRKKILAYIEKIVEEKKQNLSDDFLGILLNAEDEERNKLEENEIKDQILNMLSAGHGTLASALSSICLSLAQNPQVLEKCRKEQARIGNYDISSVQDLEAMEYLDAVIKEVLRIYPPVGGGFREIIKDCEFNGYFLPKGGRVIYNSLISHRNSNYFNFPDKFDPNRFLGKSENNLQGYFPFGGGKRRCLGENLARLEMKIFTASIISKCRWDLISGQNLNIEQLPFPHPKDNLLVEFQKIQ